MNRNPDSWYVMRDDPVLRGSDLTDPRQGVAEVAAGKREPYVSFGFAARARAAFEQVTKEIAHRGQEAQLPGISKGAAVQHFAVVLDGQLVTAPSIDDTQYPGGIDASNGSQISGGFTTASARELAEELRAGELPLRLVVRSRTIHG